jgi:hypothetical protein
MVFGSAGTIGAAVAELRAEPGRRSSRPSLAAARVVVEAADHHFCQAIGQRRRHDTKLTLSCRRRPPVPEEMGSEASQSPAFAGTGAVMIDSEIVLPIPPPAGL